MIKIGDNMIKIGHQVYSRVEVLEFVEKNKNSLLQTKNGSVIAAIHDGMCLVVSKAGRIYKAWPGELELQW
jgi:alkaline phosphatase